MRLSTPLLAALLTSLLLPSAALASSVTTEVIEHERAGPKGESQWETRVVWSADPGEANRLELRWDDARGAVVLHDSAAPIRASEGCAALTDGTVACTRGESTTASLDGGDGDDELRLDGIAGSVSGGEGDDTLVAAGKTGATLDGGPGDDTITGGPREDSIQGGTGSDTIDGGDSVDTLAGDPAGGPYAADRIDGGLGGDSIFGVDTVVYDRPDPVAADLRAGTGGAPGEGDLLVGVEGVTGGSAADELRGGDGADTLAGGGGADLLEGRGGKDRLFAGDPAARLFGGAGNDVFYATAGAVSCGPGDDYVRNPDNGTIVEAATCERVIEDMTFNALELRRTGRTLRLRLRGAFYVHSDQCGAFVALRPAGGGRLLTRRFVRLPEGRLRQLRLVAARPLPARLQVEIRAAYCSGHGPRLRPWGGFDHDERPLLRFTAALPPARR